MSQDLYKTDYYNQYSNPADEYRRSTDSEGHHYTYDSNYYNFATKFKYDLKSGTYQLESTGSQVESGRSHQPDLESQAGSDVSRRGFIANSSGKVHLYLYHSLNSIFSESVHSDKKC